MWATQFSGVFAGAQSRHAEGISNRDLRLVGGIWHLYVTTRPIPMVVVYELGAAASSYVLDDVQSLQGDGLRPTATVFLSRSGQDMAVSLGTNPTAYASHTLNVAVQTLNLSGVRQVEAVTLDEKRLLLTAGFTSSSINALLIGDDGQINPTDHVIDSLETRSQDASEIQVLMHEGRVFVLVAGQDDNLGDAVHDQPVLEVDAILRGCQPYVVAAKQPDQRSGFEIALQEITLGAAYGARGCLKNPLNSVCWRDLSATSLKLWCIRG